MLGYIAFFIDSFDNISFSELLKSYLELSFEEFYLFLHEHNIKFHYSFYFRPIDWSIFDNFDVFVFPVRCDEYGM